MPTNINFNKRLGGITKGTSIILPSAEPPTDFDIVSFEYDGIDDYMETTSTFNTIDNLSHASWSCWVKVNNFDSTQIIWQSRTASATQVQLLVLSGADAGKLYVTMCCSGANWVKTNNVLTIGAWHNITVVYDETINRYIKIKIYIDGVRSNASNFYLGTLGTGDMLFLGHNAISSATFQFDGNIDEMAIWTSSLTQDQVNEIYNLGFANDLTTLPTAPAPANWWREENASWIGGAYWEMNDEMGTGLKIRSRNTWSEAQRVDDVPNYFSRYSFLFDGIDDRFATTTNYTELAGETKATFSFWVKPNDDVLSQIVLSTARNSTTPEHSQFMIRLQPSSNSVGIFMNDTLSGQRRYGNFTNIPTGIWQHFIVCVDLNDADKAKMFQNGVEASSYTNNLSAVTVFHASPKTFWIGQNQYGYSNAFNGNIDEVAIWAGEDLRNDIGVLHGSCFPEDLNNLSTPQPTTWFRMGENLDWTGLWHLNDVNGSYINETVASSNMTIANREAEVPVFNAKSISFDGALSNFISIGNVLNMADDGSDPFSISFWIKSSSGGGVQRIVGKITSGADGYGIYQNGNILYMLIGSYLSNCVFNSYNYVFLNNNTWHHIVWTYDGSQSGAGMSLHINGGTNLLGAGITNLPINSVSTSADFLIGANNTTGSPTNFYYGELDEVAFFNSALSQTDINTIYNGGEANDISALSPVGWWRMGDCGDLFPTIIDKGSGGNDGTMTNMLESNIIEDVPT